jgi:thioredoxin-like negative regulator of GroEL
MYVVDTVRMAAGGGDEKAAQRKLQEATALFKKGSDTAGSIRLFKSAISLKPMAKAYFDLAGALLATRQYSEGLEALDVAPAAGERIA